jgi:8-amino-7-oxononanoate synthase
VERIIKSLETIREKGLYRELRYLEAAQGPYSVIDGKKVLLLSSNSYLGLCIDERLKHSAIKAIEKYGVGSGGSRLTTGSYDLHRELELKIAQFKGTEASLVFNTGYMANLGTITALADRDWVIFSDSLNHASIIDGCRLSGAKTVVYRHTDMDDLHAKVKEHQGRQGLIVTDGIFSMEGDIAPLPEIVSIAKRYKLLVMVDDAHATGVLGTDGAGTPEHFGLKGGIDIQMGTLSKALAGEGGYVAGRQCLIDYLRNKARSFIFSTALAPHTIAVSLKAIDIVMNEPEPRRALIANSLWFQDGLKSAGFRILEGITPIIPIIIGEAGAAVRFSSYLLDQGIYIPAIRQPSVPAGTSRLRATLMATHTREDLEGALQKIIQAGRELGLTKKRSIETGQGL